MKRRFGTQNLPPDRGTGITPLSDGINYGDDHPMRYPRLISPIPKQFYPGS